MKRLGIIGGLGPMATAYFFELITRMTLVECDQDHIPILIQSMPNTPDRTAYILDNSKPNPLPHMVRAGLALKEQGADYLVIPCVTAHYFYKQLCEQINLPILSLIEETALTFQKENIDKVGILATNGTIQSKFLQNTLKDYDIESIIPEEEQQKKVMKIIYNQLKAGKQPDIVLFGEVCEHLRSKGAKRLLLGCTELPLIKKDYVLENDFCDVLEVLAKAVINYNGLKVKDTYYRNTIR